MTINYDISDAEAPLRVAIERNEVVIRIGINRIDGHDYHPTIPELKFVNRRQWIKDVIREIERSEEDGSSPLTILFDKAMTEALEWGSLGVAEDSPTFIGMCEVCGEDQLPLRHTRDGGTCLKCSCVKTRTKRGRK